MDPTGEKTASGKVGLITYLGNEEPMRQALGSPEMRSAHFWAVRGSNALESCEILLLVGTPALSPETLYSICAGDLDYLPVTHYIVQMPREAQQPEAAPLDLPTRRRMLRFRGLAQCEPPGA